MAKKKHKTPAQIKAEALQKKQSYKPIEITDEVEHQLRRSIAACHLCMNMTNVKFDDFRVALPEYMVSKTAVAIKNVIANLEIIDNTLFHGLIDRCSDETKAAFNNDYFVFENMVNGFINGPEKEQTKAVNELHKEQVYEAN